MSTVLVTGASGFIGQQALPRLSARGYKIHALLPESEELPVSSVPVTWHRGDFLRREDVLGLLSETRPSHLLHFAWNVEPGKYAMSPDNLWWVQASIDLLRGFADCGGERVVMAGTCFEYNLQSGYCHERFTPHEPWTVYGAAKHALQVMLDAFASEMKLSAAWGHIFYLYGPHEHPRRLVPSVIRSMLAGEPARCSHGRQLRDFMHVGDVADAFVALLDSRVEGPVNIASGQPLSLRELVNTIADLIGRRDLVRLGEISPSPADPPVMVADVTRLREEVGWEPGRDLTQGLAETIDWWKSQPNI